MAATIQNFVETVYQFREQGLAGLEGRTRGFGSQIEKLRGGVGAMMGPSGFGAMGQLPGIFSGIATSGAGAAGAVAGVAAAFVGYSALVMKLTGDHERLKTQMAGAMSAAFKFEGAKTPLEGYRASLAAASQQMERFQHMEEEIGSDSLELAATYQTLLAAAERTGKGPAEIERATRAAALAANALGMPLESVQQSLLMMMETGVARGQFSRAIGLVGKDLANMTSDQRFETIIKAMGKFETAGVEAAKRPTVQFKMMVNEMEDLFRKASQPVFTEITGGMQSFVNLVNTHKEGISSFFRGLAMEFGIMADVLKSVLSVLGLIGGAMAKVTGMLGPSGPSAAESAQAKARMAATLAQTHATEQQILAAAHGGAGVSAVQRAFQGATGKALPGYSVKELARIYAKDYETMARVQGDEQARRAIDSTPGALAGVTVNNVNNFGGITMNNDFRDVEPDRILVAIKEQFETAGENRTQSRFAPAHGA
jgi:hypothetical protein